MECQEGGRWDNDRDNQSQYTRRKAIACEELKKTRDQAGVAEKTLLMMIASGQDITALQAVERSGES